MTRRRASPACSSAPIPARVSLTTIEHFLPPINLESIPAKLERLNRARAEMAAEAARWRPTACSFMRLEIITTPRETQVWAPTPEDAAQLRRLLKNGRHLVLRAHLRELSFFASIPDDERGEYDPARVLNVEIGADAFASLTALVEAGHELWWHRWQGEANRGTAWGVEVGSDQ